MLRSLACSRARARERGRRGREREREREEREGERETFKILFITGDCVTFKEKLSRFYSC